MAYRATVNLRVLAGIAKPNPKMGQALGPLGINMMQFCKVLVRKTKEFNAQTSHIRGDVPMKVRLTAYTDRTFKFIIKPPETTWFLRKASGMEKFTANPGWEDHGVVPVQYCYEIAKIKKHLDPDLQHVELEQILDVPF